MSFNIGGMQRIPVSSVADAAALTAKSDMFEGDLCYQEDTKVWYYYDGTNWEKVASSPITELGGGSWTSSGAGGDQNIDSFTTSGDIGGKVIYVSVVIAPTNAGTNCQFALSPTSANLGGSFLEAAMTNGNLLYRFMQNPNDNTKVDCVMQVDGVNTNIVNDAGFNTSATEIYYVNFNDVVGGKIYKVNWRAWMVE